MSCLEQKSGINAKNDNVKVLGIRVREVMHERRIELLESAAVQPGVLPPRRTVGLDACPLPNMTLEGTHHHGGAVLSVALLEKIMGKY